MTHVQPLQKISVEGVTMSAPMEVNGFPVYADDNERHDGLHLLVGVNERKQVTVTARNSGETLGSFSSTYRLPLHMPRNRTLARLHNLYYVNRMKFAYHLAVLRLQKRVSLTERYNPRTNEHSL